ISILPFVFSVLIMLFSACKKKNIIYQTDQITDYVSLQPGKTITYRMDSTNFTFYGLITTVTTYTVKDVVDTVFMDNLNRPTWRVIRYITDTAQSQPWQNLETYTMTPTVQTLEMVENNLRYLKLSLPFTNGFSWQGNSYIGTSPNNNLDLSYLSGWNYTYNSVGSSYNVIEGSIPNTLYVMQDDDYGGDSTNISSLSYRTYSIEVYAKGIGLIYKDFLHWFYQPPNNTSSTGYRTGYGIRLNMIDHN
ncbi:MAG: hypothetical protein JST47_16500, partial [Bacteroidetes bacterium]|nr:hypothetical protein [Bacteroidota bacterium]